MDYRSIPRISNSDLTEFKNHLFGYSDKKPVKAFAFGTALHSQLLEPKTAPPIPADVDAELLRYLSERVRKHRFCRWVLQFSRKENLNLFTDPDTGLDCKSKIDILHKNRLIVDFKSTSSRDYRSFLETCVKYDYDRQAAFYLDSISASRFVFIGIQKVEPYDLFYFEPTCAPRFIAQGRKKYKALLRAWQQQNYLPASWGKEETAS